MVVIDDVLVAGNAGHLVAGKITGNVNVALLDLQPLGRRFRHMLDDHALHGGRAAASRGIGFECDAFIGLPGLEREGARSRRIGLEPGVAHVAIGLVLHHRFHVDDRGDHGRHEAQHQRRREILGDLDLQGLGVRRRHHLVDIFLAPAKLGDQEGGRLVELHHALQ